MRERNSYVSMATRSKMKKKIKPVGALLFSKLNNARLKTYLYFYDIFIDLSSFIMKVVALVSGGKDSCFNILHCLANGHDLVALANLRPKDHHVQELDSFMFQTVGHDALQFYEECVGVPMYRGDITGTSKNQQLDYRRTEQDEIEDLFLLLKTVKDKHPEVDAVSVGAILSSYQRTRVEDVCNRLGLTSLAFLWQRDQLELMTEMVESAMDARLIKVAAVGLNESHLGKSLKEVYSTLLRLNQRFEVHICGEGGEFESLVLDAPFFVKKLEIVEAESIVSNDQVAYLKPIVKVVEKVESDGEFHSVHESDVDWSKFLPKRSGLLRPKFKEIYDALDGNVKPSPVMEINSLQFTSDVPQCIKTVFNKLFISNLKSSKSTVEEQVVDVFTQLNTILEKHSIDTSHIQHSTLLIKSMSNFAKINSIYVQSFTQPLPPSRVCVQTVLPSHCELQLSVVALLDASKKTGLHVQGRSYWAPANIGPYSQTVIDENLTASLSGQIPLIPASMDLSKESGLFNAVLSLQHYDNVKEVVGCTNQLSAVSFIKDQCLVSAVAKTWEEYSDLDSEVTPHNSLIIVQVEELPRGADTEWGGLAYKKMTSLYDDDESDDEDDAKVSVVDKLNIQNSVYRGNNGEIVSNLAFTQMELEQFEFSLDCHYTVYTTPDLVKSLPGNVSIDIIPVLSVWNYLGQRKAYGVVVRC